MINSWSKLPKPGLFLARRIVRIAPTYWLFITLLAVLVVVRPSAVKLEVAAEHYLYSVLSVPHSSPLEGGNLPLLQPGWSRNYQMFFHCVFALALPIAAPLRVAVAAVALGRPSALAVSAASARGPAGR